MSSIPGWSRRFALWLFAGAAGLVSAVSAATPFEEGVEAFQAGRYDVAKARFAQARDAAPGDILNQLWLGLATHATGGPFAGADEWRTATGHPRYESMAEFFRGMTYWKAGYSNDARLYFNETLLNVVDGKAVDYAPGKAALADLAAGKPVPAIADWPRLAGLPTTPSGAVPNAPAGPAVPPAQSPVAGPAPVVPPPAAPAQPPVPRPAPARRVAGYVAWEPPGTRAVGERVRFRVANAEWRTGIVREVGTQGAFRDKYLVEDERTRGTNYYHYTDVAGLERRDFWTGFFVGTWALGSGMAANERKVDGGTRDEYLYGGSTERLEVRADGSYVWTTIDGTRIRGRWQAQTDNPGIVILQGDRSRDYLFYNITEPATVQVMNEHHARLSTPDVMTTLARRRIP